LTSDRRRSSANWLWIGLEEQHPKQTAQTGWLFSIFGRSSGLFDNRPSLTPEEQPLPPRLPNVDLTEPTRKEYEQEDEGQQTREGRGTELLPAHENPSGLLQSEVERGTATANVHTCLVCQEQFASSHKLLLHELYSDGCRIQQPAYKEVYGCRHCHLRFFSLTAARHHFNISPICSKSKYLRRSRVPLDADVIPSLSQRINDTVRAAEKRYRFSTIALLEAAITIDAMTSPKISAVMGGTIEHLIRAKAKGRLYKEAQLNIQNAADEQGIKAQPRRKMDSPVVTRKTPIVPTPQSKGSSKTLTDNGKSLIRKESALREQAPWEDIVPVGADHKQQKHILTHSTPEIRRSSASHNGERIPSVVSNSEQRDQRSSQPNITVKVATDSAPPSNLNIAIASQLQQLLEQVKLLTETLLAQSHSVEAVPSKSVNSEAVQQRTADYPQVVLGAHSTDYSHVSTVTNSVQTPVVSSGALSDKLAVSESDSETRRSMRKQTKRESPEVVESQSHQSRDQSPNSSLPDSERTKKSGHRRKLDQSYFRYWEIDTHGPKSYVHARSSQQEPSQRDSLFLKAPNASRMEDPLRDRSELDDPASGEGWPESSRKQTSKATARVNTNENVPLELLAATESRSDNQRLTRQIHTQASLMKSSVHRKVDSSVINATDSNQSREHAARPATPSIPVTPPSSEMSEQSLLDELFPETSSYIQPHYPGRDPYPKLDLPSSVPVVRRNPYDKPMSKQEQMTQSFQRSHENITVLQLLHCSTELEEADFRLLIPKGKHIEGWMQDGGFIKVIPGRDPLNLERLPFYYVLFKSAASALAYQKNASRLHKLSQLHQQSSIMSPIPPPKGFLEEGEDINLATSSYLLKPLGLALSLIHVMQPYNNSLRTLIKEGGYKPIVPSTGTNDKPIYKVLMHIEGYEPSPMDLYQLLAQEGWIVRGIQWPFHNEQAGIHRLRDITDLKAKLLPVSSASPRAANVDRHRSTEVDTSLSYLRAPSEDGENAREINQMLMNRVYNRWVIDFEDEEAARRFARLWNRKVLPVSRSAKHVTWRDTEEVRMCNTEFLW
jgi:hypothetical protein